MTEAKTVAMHTGACRLLGVGGILRRLNDSSRFPQLSARTQVVMNLSPHTAPMPHTTTTRRDITMDLALEVER